MPKGACIRSVHKCVVRLISASVLPLETGSEIFLGLKVSG